MDFSVLDLVYDLCPNDPAKAMTYIKECLIASDINEVHLTSYEAQLDCSFEGVDLVSSSPCEPPVQSKTSSKGPRYIIGKSGSVQEICDKALAVSPDALCSFAWIEGSKILEHVIGRADLLDGHRTRTGKPAHSISFKQLRELGYTDLRPVDKVA